MKYETKFKKVTGLNQDLTVYPLTELVQFNTRTELKDSHGEVFTPLKIVDDMLEISQPEPDKFNMDLCAGRGQFTIRILRKFTNEHPDFNPVPYLEHYHWFNEFNVESALDIIEIFGENINLAVGPAQALKFMPHETEEVWKRGIFFWSTDYEKWMPSSKEQLKNPESITEEHQQTSKKLF